MSAWISAVNHFVQNPLTGDTESERGSDPKVSRVKQALSSKKSGPPGRKRPRGSTLLKTLFCVIPRAKPTGQRKHASKNNKAWRWETTQPKPAILKRSTESSFSASPQGPHRPKFSTGSFHRQCTSANSHPASIRRSKVHLRHLWPDLAVQQACHHRKDYGLETSVLDRHNIVNDRDLKLAAQEQQEYLLPGRRGHGPSRHRIPGQLNGSTHSLFG